METRFETVLAALVAAAGAGGAHIVASMMSGTDVNVENVEVKRRVDTQRRRLSRALDTESA